MEDQNFTPMAPYFLTVLEIVCNFQIQLSQIPGRSGTLNLLCVTEDMPYNPKLVGFLLPFFALFSKMNFSKVLLSYFSVNI